MFNNLGSFDGLSSMNFDVINTGTLTVSDKTSLGKSSTSAFTLDVSGNAIISQDSFINGVRLGKGNGTGANNTSLGFNALNVNSSGFNNTASGYNSMPINTSGNNNTSIGYTALNLNTSGSYNTALGSFNLRANASGISNTAIGYDCLSATTSSLNTAIGAFSSKSIITGQRNTAIGYYSANAYNGSYSTFIGQYATATTGLNYCTAIGYNAVATANNQIQLGTSADTVNISGSLKVAGDMSFTSITGQYMHTGYLDLQDVGTTPRNLDWTYFDGLDVWTRASIYASPYTNSLNITLDPTYCANGFNVGYGATPALTINSANNTNISGDTTIGGNVVLSNNVTIGTNTTIGNNAIINGGIKLNYANHQPTSTEIGGYNTSTAMFSTGTNNNAIGIYTSAPIGRFIMFFKFVFTMPSTAITDFIFIFRITSTEVFRDSHGATINATAGTQVTKNYSFPIDIAATANLYAIVSFGGAASFTMVSCNFNLMRIT